MPQMIERVAANMCAIEQIVEIVAGCIVTAASVWCLTGLIIATVDNVRERITARRG